jgi:hypothetical protein
MIRLRMLTDSSTNKRSNLSYYKKSPTLILEGATRTRMWE